MLPNFTKKNFFKHVYHHVNEKWEPFDEEHSVKAHFDEGSSDISSAETLLTRREPANHRFSIFFAFNMAFFGLSIVLFVVSGDRILGLGDPFDNAILRKISEHCMLSVWYGHSQLTAGSSHF